MLTSTQRGLALYGPLGRETGEKLKKLREGREWTRQQAARRLGLEHKTYCKMEYGRIILSPEVQRRVIELYFKQTDRSKTPTMPALEWQAKDQQRVEIRWFDAALWQRAAHFGVVNGVAISAVVAVALERFLLDEPALVTIQAALAVAEKLRTESILAANPDLVYILRGDPQVSKLAALAEERPAEYHPRLANWDPLWDGPASPVAGEELAAGMLAPVPKDESE